MAPWGMGSRGHIFLRYRGEFENFSSFAKSLDISFPNEGDGIQSIELDSYSDFVSPYSAPKNGYAAEMAFSLERTRRKILKRQELGKNQLLVLSSKKGTHLFCGATGFSHAPEIHCIEASHTGQRKPLDPMLQRGNAYKSMGSHAGPLEPVKFRTEEA